MNIIFLGAPSCGKGTQAKIISKKFKVVHISTGELLREKVENPRDPLGLKIKDVINKGYLVDDQLIMELIDSKIHELSNDEGILFDGFPRTVAQAEILDEMLEKSGTPLKGLLSIDVPFEELKRRMLERAKIEGRADDNEEVIEKRFREYNDKTIHVANHYKQKGIHVDVQGNCTVDEVFEAISKAIDRM
jgi:adenylate kinase